MFNENIFRGLFDAENAPIIEFSDFVICIGASLIIGIILALSYMVNTRYSKSFLITLAILPSIVCVIIMMVNGNVGTGVAVAGAFSLVRFRSVPGSAKDIGMLFLAMGAGLITGMGYIAYAFIFAFILAGIFLVYNNISALKKSKSEKYKQLRITIPENLDYGNIFNDIFDTYTSSNRLIQVKSTNMGSLFKLTYDITLTDTTREKEMIDKLRERNGNLEISISVQTNENGEL